MILKRREDSPFVMRHEFDAVKREADELRTDLYTLREAAHDLCVSLRSKPPPHEEWIAYNEQHAVLENLLNLPDSKCAMADGCDPVTCGGTTPCAHRGCFKPKDKP